MLGFLTEMYQCRIDGDNKEEEKLMSMIMTKRILIKMKLKHLN